MSRRQKDKTRGCLVTAIVILSAVLLLLLTACFQKIQLGSDPTDETTVQTQGTTQATVPEETQPSQTEDVEPSERPTEPKPTEPTETQPTQTEPPVTGEEPKDPEPVEGTVMRVIAEAAVLAQAQDGAQVLEVFSPGAQVQVLGEEDGFSILQLDGQIGYVPRDCLREAGKYLVVIDAGHQAKGNSEKEPIGPGATEKKAKVSSGTQGVVTGLAEYKLNLMVAQKLQAILESRGYLVEMVRTSHDVNMSNAERADVANRLCADAFIRVHANGSENSKTQGIMTICQTKNNPYNADLYAQSNELSQLVLEEMVEATGGKKQYVWQTDTMSGINWCQVPVTIVEMGYMSNPEEDRLLSTDEYQQKLAEGIANGIDRFFG